MEDRAWAEEFPLGGAVPFIPLVLIGRFVCAPGPVPLRAEVDEVGRSEARSALKVEACGARDGRLELVDCDCWGRAGVERFVDKLMISFPCTTRLSVDFFRSRVSI